MKAVIISPAAELDLNAITDFYLMAAGIDMASAFLTAWDGCVAHMGGFAASGSPRLAEPLAMPGLRVWPVKGFPQLALYQESAADVTVQRVLHSARDLRFALRGSV